MRRTQNILSNNIKLQNKSGIFNIFSKFSFSSTNGSSSQANISDVFLKSHQ
jgi:hypothetical protein